MHHISIYCDSELDFFPADRWVLRRWLIAEGESVAGNTVIAEIESNACVCEVVSDYRGSLKHLCEPGSVLKRGIPVALIRATEEEYRTYLRLSCRLRLEIQLTPEELHLVEMRRGSLSHDDYFLRLIRQQLA